MKESDLKGKKITVMGLGLHGGGVGTVRFLAEAGAKITVTDLKSKEELASSLEKLKGVKNVTYIFRQHRLEDFIKTDMVIKTPLAPWINQHIKLSLENKVPVEIDSSLFFKLCSNKIIGITGTKGKTTTATLIYEILKAAGKSPVKVGIGQASVLDKLKEIKKNSIVVFELSSWRLSALGRYQISPEIAVITNIYPDHLNYYKTMDSYIQDKKNIFLYQKKEDSCILNEDNEKVTDLEKEVQSQIIKFSQEKILEGESVYVKDKSIYVNNKGKERKVLEVEDLKLKGKHNLANVLTAIAVANKLGIKLETIKKVVIGFKGIAHRLELVRELKGVEYYNDSASTTPEATIFGLKSFQRPVILICGGSDKNLKVDELGEIIVQSVKGVIFLKGKGTEKIISAIKKADSNIFSTGLEIVESMEKAVELAQTVAEEGDIILLSPGMTSFGLFNNEFQRGNKFKEVVKKLK